MITLITIVDMIGFIHIQSLPTRFLELLIIQWRYPCSNCIASKTPNEILNVQIKLIIQTTTMIPIFIILLNYVNQHQRDFIIQNRSQTETKYCSLVGTPSTAKINDSSLLDNNIQFYYSKLNFISLSSIAYSLALLAVHEIRDV